jgi:hypothetical protein
MDNNDNTKVGRRQALQLFGVGLGTASGLLALTSTSARAEGLNCKEKAPIDENAKTLRRSLQYKEKAADPKKACKLCAQYEPGKYGDCGGCKVLPAAINPEGSCLSFAPMAAAAPAKK